MRDASDAGGLKDRVAHAERLEDALAREPIERHATDALHDVAEEKEVDIAVDEALAGT